VAVGKLRHTLTVFLTVVSLLLFVQHSLYPSLQQSSVPDHPASQEHATEAVDSPWLIGLQAAIIAETSLPAEAPQLSLLAALTRDNSSMYFPDVAGVYGSVW
jgi:hypothetical protein